ncbi:hypothetical protein PBY51_021212 [Eleginops maclovinus]|nr:hypothetical protein PBY51_021212 [Eleginops maclovinus]
MALSKDPLTPYSRSTSHSISLEPCHTPWKKKSLAEVFSWLRFRVLMCKDQTKDQRTLSAEGVQCQGVDSQQIHRSSRGP